MTKSQTASPGGPFWGINALKAVLCHTPHSEHKPSLILGFCIQKTKGVFCGPEVATFCSKWASTSTLQEAEDKSWYNAVVYRSWCVITRLVTLVVIAQSCREAVFDYELFVTGDNAVGN